jgi:hypothetical protein
MSGREFDSGLGFRGGYPDQQNSGFSRAIWRKIMIRNLVQFSNHVREYFG